MNYYSGFLLGLVLICSSLFYGLALTHTEKKYSAGSSVLDGSWRLREVRQLSLDGTQLSVVDASQLKAIKVVANQHFSMVSQSADGLLPAALAGRFAIDGQQYQEMAELSTGHAVEVRNYRWSLADGIWRQQWVDGQRITEQVWQLVDAN
jgi:glucose/arabinose dehydrogenase